MEGTNKLEISGKGSGGAAEAPAASYKQIPETDVEEQAVSRPRNLVKPEALVSAKSGKEADGADEKMLPTEEEKMNPNSNIGPADVKFTVNEKQNGDAKLDIGEMKSAFVGMGKEELMKYANDPFWVRLRWFLFVTFWLLWAAMLVGAVMIIYAAPKCEPPKPRTWWEQGPLAQIELDATVADLKAIKGNGVEGAIAVWPEDAYAPLNASDEFVELLQRAKEAGVHLIVELNPSGSDVWFEKAENGDDAYLDYYVWRLSSGVNASGAPEPPNNWRSPSSNRSAWLYSEKRKKFYYSPGARPQLNFRNPNVVDEFAVVVKNFLNNGAKGVSLRGTALLFADHKFEDELPDKTVKNFFFDDYDFYLHTKTAYLPEIAPVVQKWRSVAKAVSEDGPFMLAEEVKLEAYVVNRSLCVDLPRISGVFAAKNLTAIKISNALESSGFLHVTWPLWVHKNDELPADVLDIVTYLLPGTVLLNRANSTISKELLDLRRSPSITYGHTQHYKVANRSVFAFVRVASGNPGILVGLNPTDAPVTVNFPEEIPEISEEVTVKLASRSFNETGMEVKKKIDAHSVPISAHSAIVLSYVPKSEE